MQPSPVAPNRYSETVSIVIPALDEAVEIEGTLASVLRQSGPLEVVVVDGGSTDGCGLLQHRHTRIEQRRGLPHKRNEYDFYLPATSLCEQRQIQPTLLRKAGSLVSAAPPGAHEPE